MDKYKEDNLKFSVEESCGPQSLTEHDEETMVPVYDHHFPHLQKVRCDCIPMHTKLLREQDSNATNELGSV